MSKVGSGDSKNTLYCSFCGKSQHEVRKLIAGPDRIHLRRMRRTVHGHHPRGEQVLAGEVARRHSDPEGNPQGSRRLRDRPGARQEGALGRRPQSLQAAQPPDQAQRRRAREVEHPADRPDRLRQDAAGADAGAHPRRAVHDGGRDHADRSRLCRRGRREHHPQAACSRPTTMSSAPSAASSISTRSTRFRASPTIPRSPATCRARACSRRCSRSWKAPSRACRRRAAASIRSRNSCRSTPPISCSSAAAPSPASRRSSRRAGARPRSASAPR